jgi:hypothetical protein
MSWQLWVAIALIAAVVVILAVIRMRHAQHVFSDITQLERPAESSRSGLSGDDLARARARARQTAAEAGQRRSHG